MSGKNPTHKRKEAVSSTLKTGTSMLIVINYSGGIVR